MGQHVELESIVKAAIRGKINGKIKKERPEMS